MSLRQQQIAVFCATVVVIFGLLGAGIWLIAQRLTTEATLQTALLMARQVEIALADSLRERPVIVQRNSSSAQRARRHSGDFLGNVFDSRRSSEIFDHQPPSATAPLAPDRSPRPDAALSSTGAPVSKPCGWSMPTGSCCTRRSTGDGEKLPSARRSWISLRRGETLINAKRQGDNDYYDVWVPLQMPQGRARSRRPTAVDQPSGLDWAVIRIVAPTDFAVCSRRRRCIGGGVSDHDALYPPFSLIADTLRQAEAGTYAARPQYGSQDEVGASLDLIDRLVMRQRKNVGVPAPVQRLAIAARTLAHEVKTPLNALAIHLEVLRNKVSAEDGQ